MDKKNLTITILIVLLVAVLSGGGVYLWQQSDDDSEATEKVETTIVDEQKDPNEILDVAYDGIDDDTQAATPVKSDAELITEAMAAKYNETVANTDLDVNENNGQYAQGVVIFDGAISGGWWLAAKTSESWVIVADGNGVVQCSDLTGYNFPTSMVPECWDESTSALKTL